MQDNERQLLLNLMDRLISTLDELQQDPSLRQIWLETQWLRQNLNSGTLVLPRNWDLLIFKPPIALERHVEAAIAARKLANALRRHHSKELPSSSPVPEP